jgi:hypothetical protein
LIAPTDTPDKRKKAKKRQEENEMIDDLLSDISRDEMDHLDPEMTDERQFLDDYVAKLSSLQS